MRYKVPLVFAYEKNDISGCKEGYEIVNAINIEQAKSKAKIRAKNSLGLQGAKIVYLDMKQPIKIKKNGRER